jgi:hypothetical protein
MVVSHRPQVEAFSLQVENDGKVAFRRTTFGRGMLRGCIAWDSLTVLTFKNSLVRRTFGVEHHLAVVFNLRVFELWARFQPA